IVQASGTLPTSALDATVVPFISQIATLPELSRQRMSPLPSPLKSPVPTILHEAGTIPTKQLDWTVRPFISQLARLPEESRQRMSLLLSLLKSWLAASGAGPAGTFAKNTSC